MSRANVERGLNKSLYLAAHLYDAVWREGEGGYESVAKGAPKCSVAALGFNDFELEVGLAGGDFSLGVEAIKRTLLASVAPIVIFPIQDVFGFGADTRMNTPGVASGNWAYRITRSQLDSLDRKSLLRLNRLFGRK